MIEDAGDGLPIEFDLLDYRPEPWRPVDCLVIEGEFRWYLTGRFPVIAMPELARRQPGGRSALSRLSHRRGGRRKHFVNGPGGLRAEAGRNGQKDSRVGQAVGEPDAAVGSNNWVIERQRTASGRPTVASDPHIAIEAVSCWYEVHLQGGSFDVAGCAYVGIPAVIIGRNRRMTWGITNNIARSGICIRKRRAPSIPAVFCTRASGGRQRSEWRRSPSAGRPPCRSGWFARPSARSSTRCCPSRPIERVPFR